jgi:hypothetical protein
MASSLRRRSRSEIALQEAVVAALEADAELAALEADDADLVGKAKSAQSERPLP